MPEEDQDVAHERHVEVTDEQLLDLYLTGGASSIGTAFLNAGLCAEHASTLAKLQISATHQRLVDDPLFRHDVIEHLHAVLRHENPGPLQLGGGPQ